MADRRAAGLRRRAELRTRIAPLCHTHGTAAELEQCARDIWLKLLQRANVRALDMYRLRHTFASFGRVSGEAAFNVVTLPVY